MQNHSGPLLRDLIATADHPIGNIPPTVTLGDLVGTCTECVNPRVEGVDKCAFHAFKGEHRTTMLDVLTEWAS